MKRMILILLMLFIATPSFAAKRRAPAPALFDQVVSSLTLDAGFRFTPGFGDETDDQFYVGAGVSIPLAPRVNLFADFDRDFIDEPCWQARSGISFRPFGRRAP